MVKRDLTRVTICAMRVHMKMSPKSILGDGELSQTATGDDATRSNLKRKEPDNTN